MDDRIKEGEWKEHFMRLLGRVEHRMREGEEIRKEEEEEEISGEEIKEAIRKIKDGKAAGKCRVDEVLDEVWRYGGEKLTEWTKVFCNRIWKGEG